ncbi:unnamed protein product [Ectocarpus sp. 12 AP-2014]
MSDTRLSALASAARSPPRERAARRESSRNTWLSVGGSLASRRGLRAEKSRKKGSGLTRASGLHFLRSRESSLCNASLGRSLGRGGGLSLIQHNICIRRSTTMSRTQYNWGPIKWKQFRHRHDSCRAPHDD